MIKAIRQADEQAMESLLMKYKGMVVAKARRLFLQGGDQEDLIQEGMIGLYQAISRYNLDQDVPFASFAARVVDSRLYDAVRKAARKKHEPLNLSLSLDFGYLDHQEKETPKLIDSLEDRQALDPEYSLIDQEWQLAFNDFINRHLSPYEKKVATLYLTKKSYNEIAETLGVSNKSVDGALQRVRKKFTDFRKTMTEE